MKKLSILLLILASTKVIAGSPMIWQGSYAKNLASSGFVMGGSDEKTIMDLNQDPSAGAGVSAPIGSMAVVNLAGSGKLYVKTGAADTAWGPPTILAGALNNNAAVLTDGAGSLSSSSTVSDTEVGYLDGVTSSIQTQLNSKASSTLANSAIFVGNAASIATAVAMSGDATISNLGLLTITDGAVTNAKVNAAAAIDRSKLGTSTANHVVINSGTGAFSSEAQLATSRGGTGQDFSASTGLVKVASGTMSAATLVDADVSASAAITRSKLATGNNYRILANNSSGVMSENAALTSGGVCYADTNGQLATDTASIYWDATNKRLGIGTAPTSNTLTINTASQGTAFSIQAEGGTDLSEFSLHRHSDTAALGPHQIFARSRGTTASQTVVSSGDTLGKVQGLGFDGTDYERAARIEFQVDGTPGSDDMPGRIIFQVTPDGSVTPSTALTIANTKTATFAGSVVQSDTTAATSKDTGAIVTEGGLGVEDAIYAGGVVASETSLKLGDTGGGTNYITLQAPANASLTADYTLTLPADDGDANSVLTTNGSGTLSWSTVPDVAPTTYGTRSSPKNILAGVGIVSSSTIMSTTAIKQVVFVQGNSGATTITANPAIEAHTVVGAELILIGRNSTSTVTVPYQASTVDINGSAVLGASDVLTLIWDGTGWVEVSRNF